MPHVVVLVAPSLLGLVAPMQRLNVSDALMVTAENNVTVQTVLMTLTAHDDTVLTSGGHIQATGADATVNIGDTIDVSAVFHCESISSAYYSLLPRNLYPALASPALARLILEHY